MLDGALDQVEREKRLAAVEADDAFPGKRRMEEIDRPDQGREIQPLISFFLITIGTAEIALVRQDEGQTLELQLLERAWPERTRIYDRRSPKRFLVYCDSRRMSSPNP
jgi:hypothetical protein